MHVKHCLSEITGKDNFRNLKTISDLQIPCTAKYSMCIKSSHHLLS